MRSVGDEKQTISSVESAVLRSQDSTETKIPSVQTQKVAKEWIKARDALAQN
jgi:hypothetical protein